MKEAKISEIKNNLSRFLTLVRRGETVRILDRDRPIAQIVPILDAGDPGDAALADMERKGLVRRGSGVVDPSILDGDSLGRPSGVLSALLDEREHGR
jgi:antitoxin (DNA-binding transcriptional repressor) of toxin-antitoxin stability system